MMISTEFHQHYGREQPRIQNEVLGQSLIRTLAPSLRSLPRSWEREFLMSQNDLVLSHSGVVFNVAKMRLDFFISRDRNLIIFISYDHHCLYLLFFRRSVFLLFLFFLILLNHSLVKIDQIDDEEPIAIVKNMNLFYIDGMERDSDYFIITRNDMAISSLPLKREPTVQYGLCFHLSLLLLLCLLPSLFPLLSLSFYYSFLTPSL